jgi:hypothetical protein
MHVEEQTLKMALTDLSIVQIWLQEDCSLMEEQLEAVGTGHTCLFHSAKVGT